MTKKLRITSQSIQRLSGCHSDIIRVIVRASKITKLHVIRGAVSIETATEMDGLGLRELHRPSDAVMVTPNEAQWPKEPTEMAALDDSIKEAIRDHVRNVGAWWYLGGVITGVAETLHDQRIIDQPIMWMGTRSQDNSDIARFERGY